MLNFFVWNFLLSNINLMKFRRFKSTGRNHICILNCSYSASHWKILCCVSVYDRFYGCPLKILSSLEKFLVPPGKMWRWESNLIALRCIGFFFLFTTNLIDFQRPVNFPFQNNYTDTLKVHPYSSFFYREFFFA